MAKELFNAKAEILNFTADSAGIATSDGFPISDNARAALEECGINTNHVSKPLTRELLCTCDYIIGMTSIHAKLILDAFPDLKSKVYSFPTDICDPYGGDLELYRRCRDEISSGLDIIINKLQNDK